jgi:hypothetical protein
MAKTVNQLMESQFKKINEDQDSDNFYNLISSALYNAGYNLKIINDYKDEVYLKNGKKIATIIVEK